MSKEDVEIATMLQLTLAANGHTGNYTRYGADGKAGGADSLTHKELALLQREYNATHPDAHLNTKGEIDDATKAMIREKYAEAFMDKNTGVPMSFDAAKAKLKEDGIGEGGKEAAAIHGTAKRLAAEIEKSFHGDPKKEQAFQEGLKSVALESLQGAHKKYQREVDQNVQDYIAGNFRNVPVQGQTVGQALAEDRARSHADQTSLSAGIVEIADGSFVKPLPGGKAKQPLTTPGKLV